MVLRKKKYRMGFYDIGQNRTLCFHTLLMGFLTLIGFTFAAIKPDNQDIYLLVGMGAMILFILSLYQLRAAYSMYSDYLQLPQTALREPKVRFADDVEEEITVITV